MDMSNTALETSGRLTDWIPLDLKGKPVYAGIDETKRMDQMRDKINAVRNQWNDSEKCANLIDDIHQAVESDQFSRELRVLLQDVLNAHRYWADHQRTQPLAQNNSQVWSRAFTNSYASTGLKGASFIMSHLIKWTKKVLNLFSWKTTSESSRASRISTFHSHREDYSALKLYTTNDGYKKIFGYINQVFRKHEVNENEIYGAVALVEILTIDLYNYRLANVGCSKYYNFQGIVHRGLSVNPDVLAAFKNLMNKPLQNRNFSIPLAFVSTSINQNRIQEFLDKAEPGQCRMH